MKNSIALIFFFITLQVPPAKAQPVFEFRAVWVASVVNIDWPSRKGLSVNAQQSEFVHLLDMHQRNGMNAVIVQVRPAADAFYPSQYEPWSEYLMGKQGLPPTPYYDPLQFMIDETHKRGMEFHAWLNPYRAVFKIGSSSIAPSHITRIHPEWFVSYAGQKIFNPGMPEVREHVARVVKDIVSRYDIDGLHMDDYFYPYPDSKGNDFPDRKAFEKYGSGMKRADWRRSNCDSIIKTMHEIIQATKPTVKFGISPFGVWRNRTKDHDGSDTRAGVTNYDDLYADILLWMKEGWIDYVTPQLYWERGHKLCDYDTLLAWWNQNTYGRHLYIGHAMERAGTNAAWRNKDELPNQIKHLREYPTTQGSVYFSSKSFETNPNGWCDSLRNNYYALPALPPSMPWIDSIAPDKPVIEKLNDGINRLAYKGTKKIKGYVLFTVNDNLEATYENAQMVQLIVYGQAGDIDALKWFNLKKRLFVSTVDWNNNVSDWVEFK